MNFPDGSLMIIAGNLPYIWSRRSARHWCLVVACVPRDHVFGLVASRRNVPVGRDARHIWCRFLGRSKLYQIQCHVRPCGLMVFGDFILYRILEIRLYCGRRRWWARQNGMPRVFSCTYAQDKEVDSSAPFGKMLLSNRNGRYESAEGGRLCSMVLVCHTAWLEKVLSTERHVASV